MRLFLPCAKIILRSLVLLQSLTFHFLLLSLTGRKQNLVQTSEWATMCSETYLQQPRSDNLLWDILWRGSHSFACSWWWWDYDFTIRSGLKEVNGEQVPVNEQAYQFKKNYATIFLDVDNCLKGSGEFRLFHHDQCYWLSITPDRPAHFGTSHFKQWDYRPMSAWIICRAGARSSGEWPNSFIESSGQLTFKFCSRHFHKIRASRISKLGLR